LTQRADLDFSSAYLVENIEFLGLPPRRRAVGVPGANMCFLFSRGMDPELRRGIPFRANATAQPNAEELWPFGTSDWLRIG
jgi:hypothetical protein